MHDPDPDSKRFRWISIVDDQPYKKGYKSFEDRYPETRNVSYRETLAEEKETSLTIRCDRASFTLAGKIKASQFRAWCLERLGQLVSVVREFSRGDIREYLKIRDLSSAPELVRYSLQGRQFVHRIVEKLAYLKRDPRRTAVDLEASPVQLALVLEKSFRVQVPVDSAESGTEHDGYWTCPRCGGKLFTVRGKLECWELVCVQPGHRWSCAPPLNGTSAQGYPFTLDSRELSERLELLPGDNLLATISDVMKNHLPDTVFDSEVESFFIRGPYLYLRRQQEGTRGTAHPRGNDGEYHPSEHQHSEPGRRRHRNQTRSGGRRHPEGGFGITHCRVRLGKRDRTHDTPSTRHCRARSGSNLQRLEIRDTLLREFPVLLDEVVLDPADLRGGEGLHPVDAALAHRDLRVSPAAPTRRAPLATEPEPGRSCPRPAGASSRSGRGTSGSNRRRRSRP